MADLWERLNEMEKAICNPAFRNSEGGVNTLSYYVFDYNPERELDVRERIEFLRRKNANGQFDFKLVVYDLYDIIIDYLESKKYIEKCSALEAKHGLEQVSKAIGNTLRINEENNYIVKYIKDHTPENSVVFIVGIGKCYPILRAHKVLNSLHQSFTSCPVVLFFPGSYDGQELVLFDRIHDANHYRASKLVK